MRKANASSGATFVWAAVGGRNALDVSGGGNHRADFFLALSSLTCVTHALATALRLFFSLFLSNACWGAAGGRRPCLYTFAHLVTSWAARCAQQHALGVQRKQIPQPSQCVELQKRKLEYWEEIEKKKNQMGLWTSMLKAEWLPGSEPFCCPGECRCCKALFICLFSSSSASEHYLSKYPCNSLIYFYSKTVFLRHVVYTIHSSYFSFCKHRMSALKFNCVCRCLHYKLIR